MSRQSVSVEAEPIGFHYTSYGGVGCVVGPSGVEYETVYVTRTDGSYTAVKLGRMMRPGSLPIYAIARPGETRPARPDRPHTRRMRIP